ncbi:MAG: type II toxin-antitoxin system RelE/ParE family toxin [Firmicutes bacterium]|nr:type II toxin-antitoxin system RelE/ParE family toxin [Bacillota bacterium]
MPETVKYEVKFHPAAFKEYERLDHAVAEIVDKKLAALETRAEEIGKPLSGNLSGYREIKLREAGIRIIYEVSRGDSSSLGVVYVLTVQKRDKGQAFESAARRVKSSG